MSEKTCPNCGAALMPGDVFCGECGMRVREADYDLASDSLPDDVPAEAVEETLADEPVPADMPVVSEVVPPPLVRERGGTETALRVIVIVLAVVFLLGSLCLCGLGGLLLIPTESTTSSEDIGFATALCFAPGVISALLGGGAAYFAFRKR